MGPPVLTALLLWASVTLELGVVAGLVVRRRAARLVLLPLLLAAVLLSTLVGVAVPAAHTWSVWRVREFTHAGLALLLGAELALRLCVGVPGARVGAAAALSGSLAGVVLVLLLPFAGPLVTDLLPRLLLVLVWLYAVLAYLERRHPPGLDALHRVVLHGFGLYMLAHAALWATTGDDTRVVALVNAAAFNLLLLALLVVAWRPEPPLHEVSPDAASQDPAAKKPAAAERPGRDRHTHTVARSKTRSRAAVDRPLP